MAPTTHAKLPPSGAHRWLMCPGSVGLSQEFPPAPSSKHAEEGTLAHALAECILRGDKAGQKKCLATLASEADFDPDMPSQVTVYTDYVTTCRDALHGELFPELSLRLTGITGEENAHGTSDAVIIGSGTLQIVDLKYGLEPVEAKGNPQLQIYAAAALAAFSFAEVETVVMSIVQPRLPGAQISEWTITADDLRERVAIISKKAHEALSQVDMCAQNRTYVPGESQCKYCPCKSQCRALAQFCLEVAGVDVLTSSRAPVIDADEYGKVLDALPLIESWTKGLRENAVSVLLRGEKVTGWKLVSGRQGARKWGDEKEAEKALTDAKVSPAARYKKKLISPSDAEKLAKAGKLSPEGWEALQALITRTPASPALAPASDNRAEWTQTKADDYPDETKKD